MMCRCSTFVTSACDAAQYLLQQHQEEGQEGVAKGLHLMVCLQVFEKHQRLQAQSVACYPPWQVKCVI